MPAVLALALPLLLACDGTGSSVEIEEGTVIRAAADSYAIERTDNTISLSCLGAEVYEPVPGVVAPMQRAMEAQAELICGGAVRNLRHHTSVEGTDEGIVLREAKLEFSCAGRGELPNLAQADERVPGGLRKRCKAIFADFRASQD